MLDPQRPKVKPTEAFESHPHRNEIWRHRRLTARQLKHVGELLAALPCLPLDEPAADAAAEIRRTLKRNGVGIGMGDSLIAGIVVAHRGVLLTRNRRHFERVPGLPLGRMGRTEGD